MLCVRPDRPILGHWGQAELWVIAMLVMAMSSIAFALILLVSGAIRRRAVALLLGGAVLNAAFLAITGGTHMMNALRYAEGVVASGVLFGLGWVIVGAAIIRRHPMTARAWQEPGESVPQPASALLSPASTPPAPR